MERRSFLERDDGYARYEAIGHRGQVKGGHRDVTADPLGREKFVGKHAYFCKTRLQNRSVAGLSVARWRFH
jgi:hypothetical protein